MIEGFTDRRHAMAGIAALTDDLGTGMIDERRREGGGVMAIPAVAADRDMVDRSGGRTERRVVAVVARDAIAGSTAVIEYRRFELDFIVALVTILLRRQMGRVGTLANRKTAVVTNLAVAGDALVGKTRRQETGADNVADAAIVRGRNMPCRFADRTACIVIAIVTGGAIAGNAVVGESRRQKDRFGMADGTILQRRHM